MTAEAYNLVAYGMLETKHYAHADNHHSQSDCYAHRGYAYSGLRYLLAVTYLVGVYAAGYEKRKVHSLLFGS